jgi:rRNA processing protein Gar1
MRTAVAIFLCSILFCPLAAADCIPFTEAKSHIGEIRCVSGRVMRVERGERGTYYLDFCEDYRICRFTVVVFARDLKNIGDVRQLQGRVIEVHGPVQEYDGRAEIVLREARQLRGEVSKIPPLPNTYDVERQGHYSAGKFSHPKAGRKTSKKRNPAGPPIDIPEDDIE